MFYRGKRKIETPVYFNGRNIKGGQELSATQTEKDLKKIADNNLLKACALDFLEKASISYELAEKSRRRKEIDLLLNTAKKYGAKLSNEQELIKERESLR